MIVADFIRNGVEKKSERTLFKPGSYLKGDMLCALLAHNRGHYTSCGRVCELRLSPLGGPIDVSVPRLRQKASQGYQSHVSVWWH
jgi:hypothetical protein